MYEIKDVSHSHMCHTKEESHADQVHISTLQKIIHQFYQNHHETNHRFWTLSCQSNNISRRDRLDDKLNQSPYICVLIDNNKDS